MTGPKLIKPQCPVAEMSDSELEEAMAKAEKFLRAQYAAGVPFFTKAQLQDLAEQIDQCIRDDNPKDKIIVKGLDGETVTFFFKKGSDHGRHDGQDNLSLIATHPTIHYRTIEHLLHYARDEDMFNPTLAYLPMAISTETEIRNTTTGEIPDLKWPTTTDYAAVREKFDRERRRWEAHECFARLRTCLTSKGVRIPARVNKVVAFALGCMSWAELEPERGGKDGGEDGEDGAVVDDDDVERSMAQHSLMLMVRDLLVQGQGAAGGKKRDGVKCYAQDPAYTAVDKRILGEEGVTVLEDPKGFLEVDDNCVLVTASPSAPVREIVADIARPAVLVWDGLIYGEEEDEANGCCTDPVSTRVTKMMEGYVQLPWSSEEAGFEFLAVHARKDLVQDKPPYGSKL